MRYLIIGNSAAAIGAVEGIRRIDRDNPITLIADEPYPTYSRPLISYYLEGKVDREHLGYRDSDFYRVNTVEARLGVRVQRIDPEQQQVYLDNGEAVSYDLLLIATGSHPLKPPVKGLEQTGVFYFNSLDDVQAIKQFIGKGTNVAVIGAGLTGLKAAEALQYLGAQVTVADIAPLLLNTILDQTAAGIVQAHMEEQGICFRLGTPVTEVIGEEQVTGVVFADGTSLEVEAVIVASGVRPSTDLVTGSGVAFDRGIQVDERMETSISGIYAAGDVTEGWYPLLKEKRIVATLPNAYKQGEVAGQNMAGGSLRYAGGIPVNSVSFFGFPIATAGISNPVSDQTDLVVERRQDGDNYRSLTLRDDQLVGFICTNEIRRVGILYGLIRSGAKLEGCEQRLLQGEFSLLDFPLQVRLNWNWERGEGTWV